MTRILAFSDVSTWDGQKRLVDRYRPAVVALAGDVTSDGAASFWTAALERIPGFRRSRGSLRRRLGVTYSRTRKVDVIPGAAVDEWREGMRVLEQRFRHTPAFLAARKRMHVDRFYSFLRYAGRVSRVLVVKGDHDDEFAGDYHVDRIESIQGCEEVSGRTITIQDWTFLGLGFEQAANRRTLRRLISELKGQVDVVVAHVPQDNVRLVAGLKPKVLVRGHYGGAAFIIDRTPAVFTSAGHAVIDLHKHAPPRIRCPDTDVDLWRRDLSQSYPWLVPYPTPTRIS